MLAAAGLGTLKFTDTLFQRLRDAPPASGETREEFNLCAVEMARELPLGVGINNYVYAINNTPYGAQAPAYADGTKDAGVCHHIYLLTAAEMGYVGLFFFVLMIGAVQFRAFQIVRHARDPLLKAYAVGCFVGLFSLHLQGLLEWVLRQTNVWFFFCTMAGTLTAVQSLSKRLNRQGSVA